MSLYQEGHLAKGETAWFLIGQVLFQEIGEGKRGVVVQVYTSCFLSAHPSPHLTSAAPPLPVFLHHNSLHSLLPLVSFKIPTLI